MSVNPVDKSALLGEIKSDFQTLRQDLDALTEAKKTGDKDQIQSANEKFRTDAKDLRKELATLTKATHRRHRHVQLETQPPERTTGDTATKPQPAPEDTPNQPTSPGSTLDVQV
jgi:t-SNARE complex subunit (syntaxin)